MYCGIQTSQILSVEFSFDISKANYSSQLARVTETFPQDNKPQCNKTGAEEWVLLATLSSS